MCVGVRAGRTVRDSLARARGKEKTQRGHPWHQPALGGGREDQAQSTAKREADKSPVKLGRRGPRHRCRKEGPHSRSRGQRSSRPSEASELRGKRRLLLAGWRLGPPSLTLRGGGHGRPRPRVRVGGVCTCHIQGPGSTPSASPVCSIKGSSQVKLQRKQQLSVNGRPHVAATPRGRVSGCSDGRRPRRRTLGRRRQTTAVTAFGEIEDGENDA